MDKIKKPNRKKSAIALASALLSVSMLFTVACSAGTDDSSSSSSSSSTKVTQTDYQTVTNGDFQFGTSGENVSFPVSSSISWTRSNSSLSGTTATSSSYPSGIIDTSDEAYAKLFQNVSHTPTENPRTPYYYGLVEDVYSYDEEKPTANSEDKLPTEGDKILMIHNVTDGKDGKGTAQYFKSATTFTVEDYGKLSLFVKTDKLKTQALTDEFGAYIRLDNEAGETKSPLIVKNVNTQGEWVQYNFYLKASDYAASKFKVYLGLGGGSRTIVDEYVEGFAFFDNVNYTALTREEYQTAVSAGLDEELNIFTTDDAGKPVNASEESFKVSNPSKAIKDNGSKNEGFVGESQIANKLTSYSFGVSHSYADLFATTPTLSLTSGSLNDVWSGDKNFNYNDATSYKVGMNTLSNALTTTGSDFGVPFDGANGQTVYFNHSAKYGRSTRAIFGVNDGKVQKGKYYRLAFYVKVKVGNGETSGLTVNLVETKADGTPVAVTEANSSTAVLSNITMSDYENDKTNGWALAQVFIDNRLEDTDRYFKLYADFGTTDKGITDVKKLTTGTAMLTGFTLTELTEDEFGLASTSGDYVGSVSLGKDLPNGTEEDVSNDSYAFSYASGDEAVIKTKPVTPINYKGVPGGHVTVGGEKYDYAAPKTVAGLINTKYLDAYTGINLTAADVANLAKHKESNDYVQPIAIANTAATSYGYLGSTKTFSAGTSTTVSVRVKAFDSAKAYIYLVEADQLGDYGVITASGEAHGKQEKVEKTLVQTVDASTEARENGWVVVTFAVTTGNKDIDYRIELWNGSRDGNEASVGTVLFDTVEVASANLSSLRVENDRSDTAIVTNYTRKPTAVYSDDEKTNKTGEKTYEATEFCVEYARMKTLIVSFEAIDADEYVIEKTEEDSSSSTSSSSTDTTPQTSFSLPLQIVSIVISALMIIAIIIIIIKKLVGNRKAKRLASQIFYSRDSRDANQAKIRANKEKREAAAKRLADEGEQTEEQPQEEEKPYDYDNPENNLPVEEEPKDEGSEDAPADDGNGENA